MAHSIIHVPRDIGTSKYIITHVFCPLQLPDGDDHSVHNDRSLARVVATAARLYSNHVGQANIALWHSVLRMLQNLQSIVQFESLDRFQTISQFSSMDIGDVVALLIRAQNAGVVFRRQKDVTIFESFELSPKAEDAMTTEGKLICSYPGPAIEIPNLMFDDKNFLSELVNFLVHMNLDNVDASRRSSESKDTVHPRYITELLTGILRSVGCPADIARISKRVGDEVVCNDNLKLPWRRSSLWLLIRVSLQTTLDRSRLGNHTYKKFMLFFMCFLAEEKTYADLPSDLLQFMSAKISRRLRKLGSSAPDWLSRIVLQACTSLRSTIENRWRQVQATQRVSPPWTPSQLDLTRDTQLSLSGSRDYLRDSLVDHRVNPPNIAFNPEHCRRGTLGDFLSADGDFFEKSYGAEPHVTLYDVEQAVEQDMDGWLSRVTNNDEACAKLEILMDKYSSSALKTYASNPELLSIMLLTTVELWVALDKIAVKEIPILADYSPEVPMSLLESLLLCKTASRHRLRRAYIYLSRRHSRSRPTWSVFSPMITTNSFAIRFYRKSSHLRGLRTRIDQVAWDQVNGKVAELRAMNARYDELRKREAETGRAESNMDMRIAIYERPLPFDQLHAEVVVFELDCPISFNMWRAATFHILVDLCSPSVEKCDRPHLELSGYQALEPFLVKHPRSLVSLASNSRSTNFSHPSVPIPAKQEQVCIYNKLTFFGFDTRTGIPVAQALGRFDSKEHHTYKLQNEPYLNLQKYVDSTSHMSNEVIANQADCHEDLSIHEYIAFGHLRCGGSLQWLNILRELRARSLTFRRHEVYMLLAQSVSQVGPLENTAWTWHLEIQQPAFCHALLGELESLMRDVEANWLEGATMDAISHLLRLVASSPNDAVSQKALDLLHLVRGKVFSWTQELSAELLRTPGDEGSRGILRDTAAICRSTFSVDPAMIPKVLHTPEDIDILLSCAIIIHDHMPCEVSSLSAYSRLLLDRDRRLALVLESVVRDVIQADASDEGINLAIGRFWPDYHAGSKWSSLQDQSSRWFSCATSPPGDQRPQVVHLNILDGSLLVNGRPIGSWLPNEFVRHPIYKVIFGEQILAVTQGDLQGMEYSTKGLICDHRVYFSLRDNGSHLLIQAKRNKMGTSNSETIELIPPGILEGDLPAVLIEGHAHWLNLSTSVMEIRPLESLWETSPENWKVDCTPGRYRMWKGHDHLVDFRSQSWDMVSSVLRPLGTPHDLIISVSPIEVDDPASFLQLSVLLPRYDLSFYVDEDWELQSRNIRGMVYDVNQSIGTLFGLINQLVLRPKNRDTSTLELIPRCVLIPDGDVSFQIDGHHVRVEITSDRSVVKRVTYQTYRVNTDLGCLVGSANLTSKLYCAYLHALTSGCNNDPLTGRSGTEEALSVLQSASCWSNVRLGPRDAELLGLIASICPPRMWDPKQSIQKVEWRNLPASSQNHELYVLSKAIKEGYERVQLFHEGESIPLFEKFPLRDDHLLKRSARRAAYLFPFGLPRQPSRANFDVEYSGRDVVEAVASGEHRAYTAATHAYCRTATSRKDLWKMVESWAKTVSGVSGEIVVSLQYDRSWLAPDLPLIWLKTYNLLRQSDERKWFQLLFSLPAMAFSSSSLSELVPVFVAFASHPQFRFEDPPHYDSYPIVEGYFPLSTTLHKYVTNSAYPLERSPERMERAVFGESLNDLKHRQQQSYVKRRRADANVTAQELLEAWPCEMPPQCSLNPALYDVADLESKVQRYFSDCFRNLKLKEHLTCVQNHLNGLYSEASPRGTHLYSFHPSQNIPSCIPWFLTVDQLFARPAPQLPVHEGLPGYATDAGNPTPKPSTSHSDSTPLHQLIATVWANPVNLFQCRYVSALRRSARYFESEEALIHQKTANLPDIETLEEHYAWCKSSYTSALQHLQRHLGPKSESEQILHQSGQWPRITPYTLFRYLASNSPIKLSDNWKKCLVRLALLVLELQRARRLFLLHINDLHEELYKDLQNEGCDGWDAKAHPDWLLIQLQGNFLIRRVQAEVAYEIMSPRSGENTVMQLNMGEGKSSVIVPIAAVVLANGDQLVRVIVPKPLTTQTLHLLADRLGGLTNRRIYYLPFSRSLEIDHQKVAFLREIVLECMRERGILVVQPEHVLSLKLVSVEKQLSRAEDGQVAHLLLELQRWLHSRSREILDESDEILDVRSQLVFTIGHQQHVEGAPERWTTTQQVLGLVGKHASSLRQLFPLGVEYEPGPPGSFPYVRILQVDAGQKLISWIVQDIIDGLLLNISFAQLHLQSDLRDAIRNFISCEDVSPATVQLVRIYSERTLLWGGLLLLRGLLATGSLLFAFRERRWRVDYGLAPARTMLAVPYRAKDVPAQRAEFGHPEIATILTCLSYYYDGLTEEQLRVSFGILLKQHDASSDYDLWVRACPAVPESFRTLSGVNIESTEQWNKSLLPLFSRNRATVDFYLSRVVFPREANEFPSKLSSSGCDLAEKKERLVTGFSGTNDGQYLLPLHIAQCDPDHQLGTNAKVLSYLLRPENNHYMCMAHPNGNRRPTREFLEILVSQKPAIRVLLDVGAQMLDLQNHKLAEAWLDICPEASAAIYFNEVDELTVLTRNGSIQLLLSSPYVEQLDRCVVYLDDAHTRGTDIKFPTGFRAAVTLGPKVTKDRLAQGCMRMRKLGNGHSVMFFAPLEVDQRIRSLAGKDKDASDIINTTDILHWTIQETWENVQRWAPHWAQQGMDHASRYAAWSSFCGDQSTLAELSDKWLQPAAKKLEDLYEPRNTSNPASITCPDIRQRCSDLGVLSLRSVGVDEEQERELVHDVKRQVKRPPNVQPANHSIHRDVVDFIKTGVIPKRNRFMTFFVTWTKAFTIAFETLHATSAASDESYIWSHSVLVTTDFEQTVKVSEKIDDYLRPVHWILSAKRASNDLLVILSPYEANCLLPKIRLSKKVHLHLYTPRITKSMKPCDGLALYSIPTVPNGWFPPYSFMDQLNVFAGQLYLKDYETYIRLCRFLCLYARDLEENKDIIKVEPDGFIMPENRPTQSQTSIAHTFSSTPIPFLKALMGIRGKGTNFSSTHMGRLLRGQLLSEDDFNA